MKATLQQDSKQSGMTAHGKCLFKETGSQDFWICPLEM
jgi:hypothetical protein